MKKKITIALIIVAVLAVIGYILVSNKEANKAKTDIVAKKMLRYQ